MRYYIEQAVAVGPDDFKWEPYSDEGDTDSLEEAITMAKAKIQPTEHGLSGVRVWDSDQKKAVWES